MSINGKVVAISTVGYMCLAVAGWMISMTFAAWFPGQYAFALLDPLVLVLGVMGILAFVESQTLDAIVFLGGAAMLGSAEHGYIASVDVTRMTGPHSYLGWFAVLWAVFFAYVWVGSLKSGMSRMLFLLGLWLSMLSLALGGWSGMQGWVMLGGYLGLITSILAGVTSAAEIIRFGNIGNPNLPNMERPRAIAAD